jgi:hypothetical protein
MAANGSLPGDDFDWKDSSRGEVTEIQSIGMEVPGDLGISVYNGPKLSTPNLSLNPQTSNLTMNPIVVLRGAPYEVHVYGSETDFDGVLPFNPGCWDAHRARAVGRAAAPGVCARVGRACAALASPRRVLVGIHRTGEARARPRRGLVRARCTRGARCPVGPCVPFLFEERFENNEGPQPESCLKLCHFTTLAQAGGEGRR